MGVSGKGEGDREAYQTLKVWLKHSSQEGQGDRVE